MDLRCPVCDFSVEVHHPREGKVVHCEECKQDLKLIKNDEWELTIFEREKEERLLG